MKTVMIKKTRLLLETRLLIIIITNVIVRIFVIFSIRIVCITIVSLRNFYYNIYLFLQQLSDVMRLVTRVVMRIIIIITKLLLL